MLKTFLEMREIDVSEYCLTRKGKDAKGKEIDITYLPWESCLVLLYLNGASVVGYRALPDKNGSIVHCGEHHVNKDGKEGACYFVEVEVEIDGTVSVLHSPVMNGTAVVYNDTLNQLRVHNAIQRAFVKCVAVNTGLGIKLWEKEGELMDAAQEEEVFPHTPLLVKEKIEKIITAKLKSGLSNVEVLQKLGISGKDYKSIIQGLENAYWLIGALNKI